MGGLHDEVIVSGQGRPLNTQEVRRLTNDSLDLAAAEQRHGREKLQQGFLVGHRIQVP